MLQIFSSTAGAEGLLGFIGHLGHSVDLNLEEGNKELWDSNHVAFIQIVPNIQLMAAKVGNFVRGRTCGSFHLFAIQT